jgi:hypothetical protein
LDPFIECVGDPRAMGHCQGLAYRDEITKRIAMGGGKTHRSRFPSLFALTSGKHLGQGTGRELIRHYTHLAERMAGIATNADVPFDSVMELFNNATRGAGPGEELVAPAIAVGAARCEQANGSPVVLRTLSGSDLESSAWIVRKSRPEVGFASAEITLPWLATAVAGVNEAGVAVAIAPRSASYGGGVNAGAVNPRNAPHAVLLVQECLQRFEDLDGCIDWCRKRNRSGNISLVIADAAGQLAQLEVEGTECRIAESVDGFAVDGASAQTDARLRAHYRDSAGIDLEALATVGEGAAATTERAEGQLVWLEPASRSLSVRSASELGSAGKTVEIAF